jgi:hypothetical protein
MAFSVQVSDNLLSEIRRSHTVFTFVEVIGPNNQAYRLHVNDGNIQADRTADIRRRCTINCVDPDGQITPTSVDSLLTPFGTEIRPYRGVRYAETREIEVVPLGVFRLSKVTVEDVPGGTSSSTGGTPGITLEGYDRSRTIQRDKFTSPWVINSGTNVIDAIKAIVARTFDDLDFDYIDTNVTVPSSLTYDVDSDPWQACNDLATSIGCEIFFNVLGDLVIAPPIDVDALPSPDFDYIENKNCTMLDLQVVYSDDPGYNGVVLSADQPDDGSAPIRSVVWDEEPSSPTYHLGPYGEVPMVVTDSVVTTQDDADKAAAALLATLLGYSSQVAITAAVNPAIDCGTVIRIERAAVGVKDSYLVDAVQIPMLASETMTLTLRQRRTV